MIVREINMTDLRMMNLRTFKQLAEDEVCVIRRYVYRSDPEVVGVVMRYETFVKLEARAGAEPEREKGS